MQPDSIQPGPIPPAREQALAVARANPLFTGLADSDFARLTAAGRVRSLPAGAVLFRQDEPATCFYVVVSGWVRIFRLLPDGSEAVVAVFGQGESFAEAAIFNSRLYPVTAEAIDRSVLLECPGPALLDQLHREPRLAISILGAMSLHLRRLVRDVEHLQSRTTPQRVAAFLLHLTGGQGAASVRLPYEKGLIAARLGMKPETFSRALLKLRQAGVRVDRDRVSIEDLQRLRAFAAAGRGRDGPG